MRSSHGSSGSHGKHKHLNHNYPNVVSQPKPKVDKLPHGKNRLGQIILSSHKYNDNSAAAAGDDLA